jgi:tetratricopeptide (TPR) repeat protein
MSPSERFDFFLSRRGSVAAITREVADTLTGNGYTVVVQDYDIPLTANFVEAMHEAIKSSRDLVVLFTRDYETSPYTRKEFTSFEADRLQGSEERRIVILRCEDVPLRGLLAPNVYQDLVGIDDPEERRRRILAAAEGQSQARRPPPLPFVGVPSRIANFTGRAAEVDRLDAILLGGDKPAAITQATIGRAAVQGLGGVGKTALAAEYAYRFRNLYAGVWWCPAETRVGLLTGLAGLAVQLDAAASDEPDLEKAARAGLRRLAERRATWLLIYDNVESPEAIAELLPASGARVLITSRFSDWAGWAEEVSLDVLPPEEAAAFLQSRASRHDNAGAAALAEALGRLPLALDHAAAYCKRMEMRFADYAAKAASLIAIAPRGAPYPHNVAVTFDLAITATVADCPAAETLMAYLAQCAPERIPMALVNGALDGEAECAAVLLALSEVSLVKHDKFEDGAPAMTVHRLVQAVARVRAAANGTAPQAAARLVARLAAIYPEAQEGYNDPASWPLCAHLTPHVVGEHGIEPADAASWSALLNRAGGYFLGRAEYAQAEPFLREALRVCEKALGPEHPETATSLNNLALLLQHQSDYARARPLHECALTIREKALGPQHPITATSLSNLASLLQAQGDLAAARPLFERALAIHEKALGPEHPLTATSLDNLASLLQAQGDLAAARPLFERALAIRKMAFGPDHPNTAQSLNNLASLLQAQGALAAARPLFERALAIRKKALGPDHPNTAQSLNNLASLLHAQADLVAARPLFERALAIFEKALGPDHPNTAVSLNNLASLLQAQGDLVAARPLFKRALAIRKKAFGPDHSNTAESLNNLASLLRHQGDLAGAQPLFKRSLAIFEKAVGPEHPNTARVRSNYAHLLLATGRPIKALALAEVALAAHDKTLGPDHPWIRYSARVAADALAALGRIADAEALRARHGLDRDG